jgi:transposase
MTNDRLVVGIDFSKNRADLALLKSSGELLKRHQEFANNQVGYQAAKELILKTLKEQGLEGLDVAGEATSYYWLPLFIKLEQDADLAAYDTNLFLLNPKWVRWYKKAQSSNHKNDQSDPRYIGDYLRVHRPTSTWHYDERWMPLRVYTRLRFHLVKSLTREKNLFNLYLFLAYTTYTLRKPFSKYLADISQDLLRDPELLASFEGMQVDDLADFLHEQNKHLADPEQSAERLRQVLQERYQLPEDLAETLQQAIELLLDTINHLEDQIAKLEGKLVELIQSGYPEVGWLDSIPGIGLVCASGIAAEIGNLERFLNVQVWDERKQQMRFRRPQELADAIGKYAGLWWPDNSSGNFQAEEKHLSREGNAYLRYYLLEAADRLRHFLPAFTGYYKTKHDQAFHHKHKRAIVLTGRKALDLFVALLRHKEFYRAKEAAHAS